MVLRDARAEEVCGSESVLCIGISLFYGQAKPPESLFVILLDT
jgi:hypothetical protein